jgi:hypothetical protein
MAARLFALESMVYRTGALMQEWFDPIHHLPSDTPDLYQHYRTAASEYAGECALIKFYGTEVQSFCADEAVQIHGGYGYTEDFPIAKIFRESRVPRIYEGTNEINRLNLVQHLIRQSQRAGVPLIEESRRREGQPIAILPKENSQAMLSALVEQFRTVTLLGFRLAWETYGDQLREQRQEVAGAIADMTCMLYALESVALRLPKMKGAEGDAAEQASLVFARDSAMLMLERIEYLLGALDRHDLRCEWLPAVHFPEINTVKLRNQLAEHVLRRNGYPM